MNERYNEIRKLLDRWYSGETTPDEQHRLMELFAGTSELPEDLEADRDVFEALKGVGDVKMPEEYASRIDSALEREMARKPFRTRIAYYAAGAAACITLLWGGYSIFNRQEQPASQFAHKQEERPVVKTQAAADSIVMIPVTSAEPKQIAKAKPEKRRTPRPQVETEVVVETEYIEYEDTESWLPEDERERLLASNYRIVETEEEAQAIASTVLLRMGSQMAAAHADIDAMEADRSSQFPDL